MADVAQLLLDGLSRVFDNRDGHSRRAAIRAIYSADVVVTSPNGVTVGWDALDEQVRFLHRRISLNQRFTPSEPPSIGPDFGALPWRLGVTGDPIATGVDIATVWGGRIVDLRIAWSERARQTPVTLSSIGASAVS